MKTLILLSAFLISVICNGQTGYLNVGTSALIENKTMNNSVTIGAGYKFNRLSGGILADFYGIDKNKGRYVVAAIDLRGYLFEKNNSPYISLQPGYTLYNKTVEGINTKGSFAGAALVGYNFKPKDVGFTVSAGYQYTSFKSQGYTFKGNALKVNLSLLL